MSRSLIAPFGTTPGRWAASSEGRPPRYRRRHPRRRTAQAVRPVPSRCWCPGSHTRGFRYRPSQVQELVRLHGGSVTVESVYGRGTMFRVVIPLGHGHLPQEQIGAARTQASAALGARPFIEEAPRWLPDAGFDDDRVIADIATSEQEVEKHNRDRSAPLSPTTTPTCAPGRIGRSRRCILVRVSCVWWSHIAAILLGARTLGTRRLHISFLVGCGSRERIGPSIR